MKTIVAATDFSQVSVNTVNYAADLAKLQHSKLILLHVYSLPVPVNEIPIPVYDEMQIRDEANKKLQKQKARLLRRTNESIIIHTEIMSGEVVSAISDYCEQVKPYAVVMGSENLGAFERFLFGGKTVAALKRIHWPLIIVPQDIHFRKFRKIGLACDLEHADEMINAEEIIALVKEFDAELHVLYIAGKHFKPHVASGSGKVHELLGEVNPKFHYINVSGIQEGITTFAEQQDIDLLIVIPKWHDIIDQLTKPRQSKKLVLHARIPVLSIHE